MLYAATFALTLAFGALEVGYPGFASERSTAAWGPTLIAINSVGSALGGLAYGGLHLAMPVERQLPRFMSLLAVPIALHLFVDGPVGDGAAGFRRRSDDRAVDDRRYAAGVATRAARLRHRGVHVVGDGDRHRRGAGMAAGGALIERYGAKSAFVLAMASALAAAMFSLALRRR